MSTPFLFRYVSVSILIWIISTNLDKSIINVNKKEEEKKTSCTAPLHRKNSIAQ